MCVSVCVYVFVLIEFDSEISTVNLYFTEVQLPHNIQSTDSSAQSNGIVELRAVHGSYQTLQYKHEKRTHNIVSQKYFYTYIKQYNSNKFIRYTHPNNHIGQSIAFHK